MGYFSLIDACCCGEGYGFGESGVELVVGHMDSVYLLLMACQSSFSSCSVTEGSSSVPAACASRRVSVSWGVLWVSMAVLGNFISKTITQNNRLKDIKLQHRPQNFHTFFKKPPQVRYCYTVEPCLHTYLGDHNTCQHLNAQRLPW